MTDTYRFDQIAYYRNLDPLILYGDSWIYGAVTPIGDVEVPTDVYVIHEKDYNIISWTNSAKDDMPAYYVYRSSTYGHADIQRIAIVTSKDSNGNTQTCYIDYLTDNEMNIQYYYTIAAVNDIGYTSAHSEWNADINQDITYGQYAYLYTDGTTQTYWNTLDLYKQLGNFDTDRNIVPFRDLGVFYGEKPNGTRYEIKKDCNYLYATLLNLTDEQKENYNNLEYKLFMDNSEIAKNKPNILESAYVYEEDSFNILDLLNVDKNIIIPKFDIEFDDELKQFVYHSSITSDNSQSGGIISNLAIDREKFFKQYLKVTSAMHEESEDPNPDTLLPPNTGVEFVYNNRYWQVNINGAVIELDNENDHGTLADYGITYSTFSVVNPNIKIIVNEYWQLLNDDDTYTKINSSLDLKSNIVTLKDTNLESYGITYRYNLITNNTTINAELSRKVYTYFRLPYIYNSKLLQTYIVESGVTGKILNRINFKAYNYLIFPSVFGKIFNQRYIKLKELRGNLYKTDASNKAIYQNFGSYFDFVQPVWMGENAYRNCVLGTDLTAGLIDSGIDGGTFKGLNEVIYAYTQGSGVLENQDNTKYLTIYDNITSIKQLSELPVIQYYNAQASYTLGDIVCVTDNDAETVNTASLSVENFTPADSNIVLTGNDAQFGNQISIVPEFTSLSGNSNQPDYILNDCELTDVYKVDTDIEADYYMYITDDLSSAQNITISDEDPESPSNNDYYFNTIDRSIYQYTDSSWNLITNNLLCKCDTTYYYYVYDNQGLFQIIQLPDDAKYYVNVNNLYKNKLYSIPNSGDSRTAIRKLVGVNWVFYGYDVAGTKDNYIFNNYQTWEPNTVYNVGDLIVYFNSIYMCIHSHISSDTINGNFWSLIGFCPISYTHNYIINTWNLIFTNWKRQITPIKYLVYGNTLKLIGDVIYDPTNFIVKDFKDNSVVYIDYTVNTKTGYLTWTNPDTKPKDGSYVLISYNVDIRKELIKLINLIKYPQVHINYIWELPQEIKGYDFKGLKFTAKENNSSVGFTITGTPTGNNLQYSYNGSEWYTWSSNKNIILNNNEFIYVKGDNINGLSKDLNNFVQFNMTGTIEASGNINSLLDNDDGSSITEIPNDYCYHKLFSDCLALVTAPQLPNTVLKAWCYANMFNRTSLITAPELPAMNLDDGCYNGMFIECTSLVNAPQLPALTLYDRCYEAMFSGCTSLEIAPDLPATDLDSDLYSYCAMFQNCTSLKQIKLYYTGYIYGYNLVYMWVSGVGSTGTFYYNGLDTNRGVSGIPEGWDIVGF